MLMLLCVVQVRFNQTSYTIDEDEGAVHPVLVLNNQSSYDIAVQINIITGSATGNYTNTEAYIMNICYSFVKYCSYSIRNSFRH